MFDDAGEYLQNTKFALAVVCSSAGRKGDSERDRTLNEARTMVVRNYLVQNFRLDGTRIRTLGTGKNEQLGESGNVQIVVYSQSREWAAIDRFGLGGFIAYARKLGRPNLSKSSTRG